MNGGIENSSACSTAEMTLVGRSTLIPDLAQHNNRRWHGDRGAAENHVGMLRRDVQRLVVAAVAGLLAGVLPARRAARLDVLRAIATE
jgi:hypothetical protein